jgi:hypothetical protein
MTRRRRGHCLGMILSMVGGLWMQHYQVVTEIQHGLNGDHFLPMTETTFPSCHKQGFKIGKALKCMGAALVPGMPPLMAFDKFDMQ